MSHEVMLRRLETPLLGRQPCPLQNTPLGQVATLASVSVAPSSLRRSPGAWEEVSPAGQPQLSGSHRLQSRGGGGTCRVRAQCGQKGVEECPASCADPP